MSKILYGPWKGTNLTIDALREAEPVKNVYLIHEGEELKIELGAGANLDWAVAKAVSGPSEDVLWQIRQCEVKST